MEVATTTGIRTLAFPGISTGVYGYPIRQAAKVAVAAVNAAMSENCPVQEVVFCCFSLGDLLVYEALLNGTTP